MSDCVLITVQVLGEDFDVGRGEVKIVNSDAGAPFRLIAHSDDWEAMMNWAHTNSEGGDQA